MFIPVLQFFDATGKTDDQVVKAVKEQKQTDTNKPLRCKACGHIITSINEKISVNDSHLHTCKNPAGYVYTVGCFRVAPGCLVAGPASSEHTWFSGYFWQIAVCTSCGDHLGWLFRNHDSFFALITDKLKSG